MKRNFSEDGQVWMNRAMLAHLETLAKQWGVNRKTLLNEAVRNYLGRAKFPGY